MAGGSLLLIAVPLAAAVATFLLRRWLDAAAILAAVVSGSLALVALQNPLDAPQDILGRVVVLSTGDRIGLVFLFALAAAIFVGTWLSTPGWSYYPIGLAVLGALAGALIIRPPLNEFYPSFVYSALFIALATVLCVFPLQGGRPGVTAGVTRFLVFMSMALPILLLADLTVSQLTQSPDSTDLRQTTILLVVVGFMFLLAIFPFHTWVPTVAREAPPLSTAFVLTVLLGAIVILLLDVLNENRLLISDPRTLDLLRGAGLLMIGLGALLAWSQANFGGLLGYGTIVAIGTTLLAISRGSAVGVATAFFIMLAQALSTGPLVMGMAVARQRLGTNEFSALSGLVRRLPWAALGIMAGCLSMAGLPPLVGFVGRWALLQEIGASDPAATALVLVATASIAVGALRGLRDMLRPAEGEAVAASRRDHGASAVIVMAVAACVLVGLFPGVLAPIVHQFAAAYSAFVR